MSPALRICLRVATVVGAAACLLLPPDPLSAQRRDSRAARTSRDANKEGVRIRLNPEDPEEHRSQEILFDRWFAWKTAINEGDLGAADVRQREILGLISQGVATQGLEVLAGATVREGYALLDAGREDEARSAFELATAVDPDLPQVHFGEATLALHNRDPVGWVRSSMAGVAAQMRGIWGSYYLRANGLLVLIVAVALFSVIFALAEMFKYNRLFRHGVWEKLSRRTTPDLARMVAFGLLMLPLLLWLGPLYLALWWLVVLCRHMEPVEKGASWVALVCIALLPLGLAALHDTTSFLDSPVLRGVQSISARDLDQKTVLDLERTVGMHPDALNLRFLYTTALLKAGKEDEARMQLQEIVERDPTFERAWTNLGNIAFREGDYRLAVQQYQKAVERGSCDALAQYNMAQAYGFLLEMNQYHTYVAAARDCDSKLVDKLSNQEGVVDARLTEEEIGELVRSFDREEEAVKSTSLVSSLANPMTVTGGIAGILLVLATTRRRRSPARACVKCGRPFCSACQPGAETSAYCTQCIHLYIKRDGLAPDVRVRKVREVDRHASRVRWLSRGLNFLLPGSGDVHEGRNAYGIFLLALWCLFLGGLLFGGGAITYPKQVAAGGRSFLLLADLLVLFLVWAWANLVPLLTRR